MTIQRHLCSGTSPAPTVYIYCEPEDHKAWFPLLFADITEAIRCNVVWQDPENTFDPTLIPDNTDFVAAVVTTRQIAAKDSRVKTFADATCKRKFPLLYVVMDDETKKAFTIPEEELPFLRRTFHPTAGLVYDDKLRRILTAALTRQPCREVVRKYLAGDAKASADIYELAGEDPRLLLSLGCLQEANLLLCTMLKDISAKDMTTEQLDLELLRGDLAFRLHETLQPTLSFLKVFAQSEQHTCPPPACRSRSLLGLSQCHAHKPDLHETTLKRAIHALQVDKLSKNWPRIKEMLIYAQLEAAAIYEKNPETVGRAKRTYQQALSLQSRLIDEQSTADHWLRYKYILQRFQEFYATSGNRREAKNLLPNLLLAETTLSDEFGITDWTYRRESVLNYRRMGDVFLIGQEYEEAEEQYQHAFEIAETIFRSTGLDEDRMLCVTTSNTLGIALMSQGIADEAEEAYLRAMTLIRQLSDYPDQTAYLRNLSDTAGNLADLYEQTEQLSRAVGYYETCLDALEQLAKLVSTRGQYQELAQWHLDFSQLLDSLGRHADAMLHYSRASALEDQADAL